MRHNRKSEQARSISSILSLSPSAGASKALRIYSTRRYKKCAHSSPRRTCVGTHHHMVVNASGRAAPLGLVYAV
eukprot:6203358-Prymnesium_polylepis.3